VPVDGMDKLEIQDKFSQIRMHLSAYENDEDVSAESAYKAIKEEVNQ